MDRHLEKSEAASIQSPGVIFESDGFYKSLHLGICIKASAGSLGSTTFDLEQSLDGSSWMPLMDTTGAVMTGISASNLLGSDRFYGAYLRISVATGTGKSGDEVDVLVMGF